MEGPH